MTLKTKLALSLIALVTMSGCSKCGSSAPQTDKQSPTAVSSKAQYIKKVDSLCESNDDKLAKELESMPKPTTPEEALQWSVTSLNKSLDSQEALAKEIQALEKPSEDSGLLQQVFEADAKRREMARAFAQVLLNEITQSALSEQQGQVKAAAANASNLAKQYGFTFCFIAEDQPAQ